MIDQTYVGTELELFSHARYWKGYVARTVAPYLGNRVLEVGAGIGTTTETLHQSHHQQWLCLEPDPEQCREIETRVADGRLPKYCRTVEGTLAALDDDAKFNTIVYMDVLEHIEHDADEMQAAARHLAPGGYLVVLCPAHQSLYTPFDRAIGHYRRYSRQMLAAAVPPELQRVLLRYLDSVGLCASLANRFMLRQSMPTKGQIALWDNYMVRASKLVDPLLCYRLGKSVLGVWQLRTPSPSGRGPG